MSTSCTTSATSTATDLRTTSSVSTSYSPSVTTAPGSTSIILTSSCAQFSTLSDNSTTCISSTTSSSTTTLGGGVTTTEVPVETTIYVTQTQYSTLYGSSCTVISTPHSPGSSPVTTSSSSTPPPPPVVVTSATTPPPVIVTLTSSSSLDGGGVTVQVVTFTSTQPPTQVTMNSSNSATTSAAAAATSSSNLGAIIGGIVGGIVGITAIAAIVWFIMKRRQRWNDIHETDAALAGNGRSGPNHFSHMSTTDIEPEPKPYEYGYVGNAYTRPPAQSPNSASSKSSTVHPANGSDNRGSYRSVPSGTAVLHQQQSNNAQQRPMSLHSTSSGGIAPIVPPGMSPPHQQRPLSSLSVSSGGFAPVFPPGMSPPGSRPGSSNTRGQSGNEDYFNLRASAGSPGSFTGEGHRLQQMSPHTDLRSSGVIPEDSTVMSTDQRGSGSKPPHSSRMSTSGARHSGKSQPAVLAPPDQSGSGGNDNGGIMHDGQEGAPPPAYEA